MLTGRKAFLIFLLLVATVAGVIYFRLPLSVNVAHPSRGQVVEAVYATGTVEADPPIHVATERAARLTALLADEGMQVKTGQVLAKFDDAELQATLREMQIRQRNAENNLSRVGKLYQRRMVSAELLDQARTEAEAAREVTRRTSVQMNALTLISPVDGEIIKRDGEIGNYMPANQVVFSLRKSATQLRLTADVDEEDIPRVKPAQRVLITADAFPGKVFEGIIREITPEGDSVTRSYRVRISLSDDVPFFIGMTAESNILISQRDNALLVPNLSIMDNAVWLVKDGKAFRQPVTTGVKNADKTEITEGITDQDSIIIEPPEKLKAGQAVREVWSGPPDKSS